MSALNLDLVDVLLKREDLGPVALDVSADLLRSMPEPPGCALAGFDGRGACQDMADVLAVGAALARGENCEACGEVLRTALPSLVQSWVPVLVLLDGPAGLRPAMHEGVVVTGRAAWRARLTDLFGAAGAAAIMAWAHELRLKQEVEVGHDDDDETA